MEGEFWLESRATATLKQVERCVGRTPPVETSQGFRTAEYTLLSRWTTPAKLTTVATPMTSGARSSVSGIGAEQSLLKSGGHWQFSRCLRYAGADRPIQQRLSVALVGGLSLLPQVPES